MLLEATEGESTYSPLRLLAHFKKKTERRKSTRDPGLDYGPWFDVAALPLPIGFSSSPSD